MVFELKFTEQANDDLDLLEQNPHLRKRLKAVRKSLGFLQMNSKHPGFGHYGPGKQVITIVAITQHP